ncbi:MAG: hypothetical protein ACP5MJ_09015, partial [Roseiflexus sp.]
WLPVPGMARGARRITRFLAALEMTGGDTGPCHGERSETSSSTATGLRMARGARRKARFLAALEMTGGPPDRVMSSGARRKARFLAAREMTGGGHRSLSWRAERDIFIHDVGYWSPAWRAERAGLRDFSLRAK